MIDLSGPDAPKTGNPRLDRPAAGLSEVIIYGIFGMIILIIALIFMADYFTAVKETIVSESAPKPESAALTELQARETEQLTGYEVTNLERRTYAIPIERAKKLLADEAQRERQKDIGD
jgi:hypothetical protein